LVSLKKLGGIKMAILPEVVNSRWLFADDVNENDLVTCTGCDLEFRSKNDKLVPIFIFWGKTTKNPYEGELQVALWNIANYRDLKKKYPDTDAWIHKQFKLKPVAKGKIEFNEVA
jgi:hypothetical protein